MYSLKHLFTCVLLTSGALITAIPLRAAEDSDDQKAPKVTYDDDVKPVLRQKCFGCHNPDRKSGDLDLTNFTNLMIGGGSGKVVEAGDASSSYLYQLITHEEEPYMPPESPKIAGDMIETVRKWIDGGLLENQGSQAAVSKKKKVDFTLKDAPTDRPAEPPMPDRLSLEPVLRTETGSAVTALATSPWSPILAVAGIQQVLIYHTQSLELLGVLPFPEGIPEVLHFSRNGSLLLAGGGQAAVNGRVVVWDLKTGQRIFEVGDELDTVLAADISSDQSLIALGGPQKVVRIYSTESGELVHELRKHTDWIYSLEFSPDSVLLATGDRAGNLFVWEAWTGREYLTLSGHSAGVTAVSWRSDSNVLASGSEDATIRLWEMENGGEVQKWTAHPGGVLSLELARDGRALSCGRDHVTKLFDPGGQQLVAFEGFSDLAVCATFCDESNSAIAGDWSGEIRAWNAADGTRIGNVTANPPTLAERVALAMQQVAKCQAELDAATAVWQSAQATLEQLRSEPEANDAEPSDPDSTASATQADIEKAQTAVNTARQTVDDVTARLTSAQQELSRWQDEVTFSESQNNR